MALKCSIKPLDPISKQSIIYYQYLSRVLDINDSR